MPAIKHLLEFTSVACKNAAKMFPAPKDSPFKKNLLDDKICLITAGSSKLSLALAHCFAEHSAGVILAEQKEAPVEAARQLSKVIDKEIGAVRIDSCDETSINEVFDYIQKEMGKPCNVLINHCPLRFTIPSEQITIADIQLSCDALSTSAFLMTKSMYARNANSIPSTVLNVTTNFSQCSIPFSAVSSMALAAVEAMTRSLSNEFAKGGLRINAIAPNSVLADEEDSGKVDNQQINANLSLPIGREILKREIAYTAAYLCSSYANAMTGSVITVDGGQRHVLHPNNLLHGLNESEWGEIIEKQQEQKNLYTRCA